MYASTPSAAQCHIADTAKAINRGKELKLPDPADSLISTKDMNRYIEDVGTKIAREFHFRPLVIVPILTGAMKFACDLTGHLSHVPLRVEPVLAKSYDGTERTDDLHVDLMGLDGAEVGNHDVLIVDDIFDSGKTLEAVTSEVQSRCRSASSVKTAVMLEKIGTASPDIKIRPDFFAASIEDKFVVGRGLDYRGFYRNLNYIGVLSQKNIDFVDHLISNIPGLEGAEPRKAK